jgi:2-iminobutanoate/2-iminopropanoate deaminase
MANENTAPRKEILVGSAIPGLPFSAVVGYGDLMFVSGIVGRDFDTRAIAIGDMGAQTTQMLRNIQGFLARAGSSMDKVLKVTVFVTDMSRFQEMNQAYRQFFPSEPPARSTIGVASLPEAEALVEAEVIAAR